MDRPNESQLGTIVQRVDMNEEDALYSICRLSHLREDAMEDQLKVGARDSAQYLLRLGFDDWDPRK